MTMTPNMIAAGRAKAAELGADHYISTFVLGPVYEAMDAARPPREVTDEMVERFSTVYHKFNGSYLDSVRAALAAALGAPDAAPVATQPPGKSVWTKAKEDAVLAALQALFLAVQRSDDSPAQRQILLSYLDRLSAAFAQERGHE